MDIQQKLTGFAMMGATWIMWLLVGLSVGGVAVAIERAIYLIVTRENVRKLKHRSWRCSARANWTRYGRGSPGRARTSQGSSRRRSRGTGMAPPPPKSA